MGTASSSGMQAEQYGIIPRVINELFELIKKRENTHTYVLSLSFLEIYKSVPPHAVAACTGMERAPWTVDRGPWTGAGAEGAVSTRAHCGMSSPPPPIRPDPTCVSLPVCLSAAVVPSSTALSVLCTSDEIFDLLCTIPRGRADRPVPQIKESRNDKIEVENVVKAEVKSAEETFESVQRHSDTRTRTRTRTYTHTASQWATERALAAGMAV